MNETVRRESNQRQCAHEASVPATRPTGGSNYCSNRSKCHLISTKNVEITLAYALRIKQLKEF